MLYTRNGDKGNSILWEKGKRMKKDSLLAEALGAVDEINSLLGLCKVASKGINFGGTSLPSLVEDIQNDLFVIQAELVGSPKNIKKEDIKKVEAIIDGIEKVLPPIKSFFISGGSEAGALFDFARTVSRRAERRVITLARKQDVSEEMLAYMNRLSSLLYAFVRLANKESGEKEKAPSY